MHDEPPSVTLALILGDGAPVRDPFSSQIEAGIRYDLMTDNELPQATGLGSVYRLDPQ